MGVELIVGYQLAEQGKARKARLVVEQREKELFFFCLPRCICRPILPGQRPRQGLRVSTGSTNLVLCRVSADTGVWTGCGGASQTTTTVSGW